MREAGHLSSRAALLLAAALVAGGALWLLQWKPETVAPAAPDAAPAEGPAPAAPGPLVRPLDLEAKAPPAPEEPAVVYPDGTRIAPLNGVTEPVKLIWPVSVELTPIVGTIRDGPPDYWEWYVHENGAQSTVVMAPRKPGGPILPNGIVRAPFAMEKPGR